MRAEEGSRGRLLGRVAQEAHVQAQQRQREQQRVADRGRRAGRDDVDALGVGYQRRRTFDSLRLDLVGGKNGGANLLVHVIGETAARPVHRRRAVRRLFAGCGEGEAQVLVTREADELGEAHDGARAHGCALGEGDDRLARDTVRVFEDRGCDARFDGALGRGTVADARQDAVEHR